MLLHRAFARAHGAGKVAPIPRFPTVRIGSARGGLFESDEWQPIREHLAGTYEDVGDFAYLTCWRIMEAFGLRWADVDFQTGFVRLPGRKTKSGRARSFPFRAMPSFALCSSGVTRKPMRRNTRASALFRMCFMVRLIARSSEQTSAQRRASDGRGAALVLPLDCLDAFHTISVAQRCAISNAPVWLLSGDGACRTQNRIGLPAV
jgi:hypothetical protein